VLSTFISQIGFNSPSLVASPDGIVRMAFAAGLAPASVIYAQCAGNCGVASSWTLTTLDQQDGAREVRLLQGTDGRLHLIYELYTSTAYWEYYSTCASNCTSAANWTKVDTSSLLAGTQAVGARAVTVIDSSNRISFLTKTRTSNATIQLTTCASNCTQLSSWQSGTIRTGGGHVLRCAPDGMR
jgi:hypothetical protein